MQVILENLGKRFNKQWVFRGLNANLKLGGRYVIKGSNGSGKSTLLQTIAGYRLPSEGSVRFTNESGILNADQLYRYVSIASPYLTLIEEFTIKELLNFHFSLQPLIPSVTKQDFIQLLQMQNIAGKPIGQYSSGMKQRLKLALAFFTAKPLLLLDEPCSNLDANGVLWYRNLLENHTQDRLVAICSNNQENEYMPCENIIEINDFKRINAVKSS